jgi:predicted dehydrogenase
MTTNSELGIALIGAGGMAKNYRDNYAAIPGTRYRLIVDVNLDVAREAAAEHGVERFSTDWRDALAGNIQIADISTPNHLHAEQATTLLAGGKHVLLQKPMAPTIEECQAIVRAAEAAGRTAGVYMSDLEDPVAWDLRDIVQGGYLGRVSSVRARYAHKGGLNAPPNPDNWRGSAEKTGGGSFMQLSIHHTNLLSWMLDDSIASVMGYAKNQMCPNIGGDDTAVSVAEFGKSGILAIFDSAWNADGSILEIYGSEGHVKMLGGQGAAVEARLNRPFQGRVMKVPEANQATMTPAVAGTRNQCRADNPLNQHVAFVQAIQRGEPAPVPADIGLYDVAVVKAVYKSAAEGTRVQVRDLLK